MFFCAPPLETLSSRLDSSSSPPRPELWLAEEPVDWHDEFSAFPPKELTKEVERRCVEAAEQQLDEAAVLVDVDEHVIFPAALRFPIERDRFVVCLSARALAPRQGPLRLRPVAHAEGRSVYQVELLRQVTTFPKRGTNFLEAMLRERLTMSSALQMDPHPRCAARAEWGYQWGGLGDAVNSNCMVTPARNGSARQRPWSL